MASRRASTTSRPASRRSGTTTSTSFRAIRGTSCTGVVASDHARGACAYAEALARARLASRGHPAGMWRLERYRASVPCVRRAAMIAWPPSLRRLSPGPAAQSARDLLPSCSARPARTGSRTARSALFIEPSVPLEIVDYVHRRMRQRAQVARDEFVGGPRLLERTRRCALAPAECRRPDRRAPPQRKASDSQSTHRLSGDGPKGDVRLARKLMRPAGRAAPSRGARAGFWSCDWDTYDLWSLFFGAQASPALTGKRGSARRPARTTRASTIETALLAGDVLAA